MFSLPTRRTGTRRQVATALGVLGAALALTATTAGGATAAPQPDRDRAKVQPGEAYMGVGARIHEGAPADEPSMGIMAPTDGVQGIDVSHWQGAINWTSVRNAGIQFAWIKATEGTTYKDDRFNSNYTNAYHAGVIRGAYHFARPNVSNGATQANFFASSGGAWSRDNLTLPGVLDIEHNPYGAMCYGLSTTAMRTWITDFYNTYKARTSRDVVIYTTASWWNTCTGNWTGMGGKSPLWAAHWGASSPTIPAGFPTWTVWQYTATGSVSGVSGNVDRNQFNGSRDRLLALANNT
ncbi:lysozyme [Streptomyces virens]|uniref:lysozyme n=2 Tax=Streptomyces TaxID=1883 RepID=A0A514JLE9_9ACTN|nr:MULTISPECIES: lysozyme [Streptomyces]MBA8942302.1 GH25 family lysozyme M1 (1,4-beta-N-acetylmuramidase) [Streptomyces calvus]MBA8975762.1 GH25 family lysozyme M1 (1,4-beta-N-acetylmuramidase) [Streptomyces calvus]MYS26898.1 lysozyme [Streptomyces sp. SID7804]QDI68156.1 lysozyme [Streptomyces calvus]GGP51335.1 hydrolase [Streptomyces calvus]